MGPSETLPLMDELVSPGLRKGKELAQSHTARPWLLASFLTKSPRGSGVSPLGRIQDSEPPGGWMELGDPDWAP